MKVLILCWILWITGFIGGSVAMALDPPSRFLVGCIMGFIGGILVYQIAKYFDRRMKCKNS